MAEHPSSLEFKVVRVRRQFVPPGKKRDVEITIEPCQIDECVTCDQVKPGSSSWMRNQQKSVDKPGLRQENLRRAHISADLTNEVSTYTVTSQNICNSGGGSQPDPSDSITYSVLFAKASTRKHKIWEGDGFLIIRGRDLTLKSQSGKILETSRNYKLPEELESGTVLKLGGKEVELQDVCQSCSPVRDNAKVAIELPVTSSQVRLPVKTLPKPFINPCPPGSRNVVDRGNKDIAKPLFSPNDPGAFVLPEPEWDHQRIYNPDDYPVIPVVVDPHLSRHLREHQRQGVEFLYKSVYLSPLPASGAILADDMGLGKTLQCITLIWTLLKQGPYGRKEVMKRILIVTPSSLVNNWEKEFARWLGNERLRVFAVNSSCPLDRYPGTVPVIIISYEMAIRSENLLKSKKIDLIVCDEAHKIKNVKNQAYQMLKNLACPRRILLTGTPVQNDLMELYSLVDFVMPTVLGSDSEFRKEFLVPIAKVQEDGSSRLQKGIGMMTAQRLNATISSFFLRRDSSVMLKYLPGRVTQVIFCKPAQLQSKLYRAVVNSEITMDCINGSCQSPLAVILLLKKLCNHPYLAHPKNQTDSKNTEINDLLKKVFPSHVNNERMDVVDSGKLMVLEHMLGQFYRGGHKVVLVSHYTKTLNVLENLCQGRGFNSVRLDGSTPSKERIGIVDKFSSSRDPVIFLLSSKAGGVGLNLQSSSKIILYDIDWNPAHDIQAMARCWRPGQRKETHIYRLLTSGTIEERIYQRQISKQDVSGSVVDLLLGNNVRFSPDELKDIFAFYEDGCLTHDLMQCECDGTGDNKQNVVSARDEDDIDLDLDLPKENNPPRKKRKIDGMGELLNWEHFHQPLDDCDLETAVIHPKVDFIFRNKSTVSLDDSTCSED